MRRKRMGGGRLVRLVRWLHPDRNPLRRGIDRMEGMATLALLALFLAGAPLAAVAAGSWSAAASRATLQAEAGWHPTRAVVLQNAPRTAHALGQAAPPAMVRARWSAPDGSRRTGMVQVPGTTRAGRAVTIWTDRQGRRTTFPLQHSDLVARALLVIMLAVAAVGAALGACWLVIRLTANRRRLAAWDVNWESTGPQWTGQH